MNLYQIYWVSGYEGDWGGILSHDKKFTQEEFDLIVEESRDSIGGYSTMLNEIEDYMVDNYGFRKVDYMLSCT